MPSAGHRRERDLLPFQESVVFLGKGPAALRTLDFPRYVEMAEYAFKRLAWDGGRFDAYRCRVAYPVMPSTVTFWFDLPKQPVRKT